VVILDRTSLADYSYGELKALVEELIQAAGTRAWQDRLLEHFIELVGHPSGSDLIYNPASGKDESAEQIVQRVIGWRTAEGLVSLRDMS